MSFSFILSSLWSVALLTVVPANLTGSNTAVGVILPVLPTSIIMSNNFVVFRSAGNLYAIAHLGLFAVNPIFSLCAKLLTLITIPSIPNAKSSLWSVQYSICFIISSILL